ncbi:hypothetical protein [Spirosoma sp.]|uniref:hypothetical protein n=1 Tax=Spirosoma sp. TaxID=1899569 RepID=UPI003B3AC22E
MKTLKFISLLVFPLALLAGQTSYGQRPTTQAVPKDTSFNTFLQTLEQANINFINGNPVLWKQLCAQSDEATILGGFGGYEKGWKEVDSRYDWASSRFKASGAKKRFEYVGKIVSGNLAYTVTIERSEYLLINQEKPTVEALRVTQIYRKEASGWKLLHRHADPFLEKKSPNTTSQPKN